MGTISRRSSKLPCEVHSRPSSNALRGKARRAGGVLSRVNARSPTSLCTPEEEADSLLQWRNDDFRPGVRATSEIRALVEDVTRGPAIKATQSQHLPSS